MYHQPEHMKRIVTATILIRRYAAHATVD